MPPARRTDRLCGVRSPVLIAFVLLFQVGSSWVSTSLASGQDNQPSDEKELEQALRDSLEEKPFALRRFHRGERLAYDLAGNQLTGGIEGPWTLYGVIEIRRVNLKKDKLELKGRRLYARYVQEQDGFTFVRGHDVRIEVLLRPEEKNRQLLRRLEETLLTNRAGLYKLVPPYWKPFMAKWRSVAERTRGSEGAPLDGPPQLRRRGVGHLRDASDVAPPRCLFCRDPEYTWEAREAKVKGTVFLSATIDKDGRARDIVLVQPLGFGLDEKTIEAVREWRFEPARKDGQPVPLAVDIEVNFRLY